MTERSLKAVHDLAEKRDNPEDALQYLISAENPNCPIHETMIHLNKAANWSKN